MFLFGILQGNEKTSWLLIIPVGIIYFFLYYFIFSFLIKKFNLKTPGREDSGTETRLYTKADVRAAKNDNGGAGGNDEISVKITKGLGGKANINDVDCCATRLRCTVKDSSLIDDAVLKSTGASGVIHKGNGVQVIYGPNVTVIKSNLEDYLDAIDENAEGDEGKVVKSVIISSPVTGTAAGIEEAPDEAFAGKMMGDGAVVTPKESAVYAPADGTISFVFDTKHAIGFTTDSGLSLLIHIGIDTVNLKGEGFKVLVENGDEVKKGAKIMELDLDYIKKNAPSLVSPVICSELSDNQRIRLLSEGEVKAGDELFAVDFYE